MQRRKYLAALGSLAAGGAAMTGTGAFTSVSADRSIAVQTANDSDAFLSITKDKDSNGDVTPNAEEYVTTSNGQVSLDITSTGAGGQGLNDNATTVIDNLLTIENKGTQGVYVGYTHPASPNGNFALYHEDEDFRDGSGGSNYDDAAGNYNNDGQLNINTAPDNDSDGNPDLVFLQPGDQLNHIGVFFFGSPDVSAISSSPVTFKAANTFEDL